MSKSPNLGLTLTSESESDKKFKDFRKEIAGDGDDSNMMIIDTEVGAIKQQYEELNTKPFTWGMLKNGIKNT